MRALVTGGAGFIGSTLVDRLLAEGHAVDVVDNLATGKRANLAGAEAAGERFGLAELDVRSPEVADHIAERRPEVVFHLAAQIDVRVSVARPAFDAEVNVVGGLNVAEGARQAGARVVFASSGGTIYGDVDPAELPVDESHPQRPVSPYGVAKKATGDYLFAYEALHGLESVALALANVYGPRQDPHGEAGVVAIFAGRLLSGQPCTVFGDGEQTRDYVYVDDVVAAQIAAFEHPEATGAFNVGTGRESSVLDVVRGLAPAARANFEPEMAPPRPGELERSCLDVSRARDELGFSARTELADGLQRTLAWAQAAA